MTAAPALLDADGARIAVDGVSTLEGITLRSVGDRLVVVGEASALFAALTGVPLGVRARRTFGPLSPRRDEPAHDDVPGALPGEARVVAGSLRLAGRDVAREEHVGHVGMAALDSALPLDRSVVEHVAWSARLAGVSRRSAVELAQGALATTGLARAATRPLATLVLPERRALALAAAIVTAPETLVAEHPLAGLEGPAAAFVAEALEGAVAGRRAILSVASAAPGSLEGALVLGASHAAWIVGGAVVADGPPSEVLAAAKTLAVHVRTNGEAFVHALEARGIGVRGAPPRLVLALPEGAAARDVLAAAVEVRAAVVELLPLA